jgi:hypothetical protein
MRESMLYPVGLTRKELMCSPRSTLFAILNPIIVPVPRVVYENQYPEEIEVPALLVMDSLKLHNSSTIASNVRQWLSHKWSKKTSDAGCSIFIDSAIKLIKLIGKCVPILHTLVLCFVSLTTGKKYSLLQFIYKVMVLIVVCFSVDMLMHCIT